MDQEEHKAQTNLFPFSVISGAKIAFSIFLGFFFMIFGFFLLEDSPLNKTDQTHLLSGLFTLLILAGILLQFRNHSHLWDTILRPPEKKNRWLLLLIVIPLILLSLGTHWFWNILQLEIIPGYWEAKQEWISQIPLIDQNSGPFGIIILTFSAVVIAPLAEELLFRGVLFDKISHKWNPLTGITVTSILFAVLHMNPLGAFFFSWALCLIYLQCRSLLIPIFCHALNNLIAVYLALGAFSEVSFLENRDQFYSQAWFGITLLLIGTVWMAWFIYRRYSLLSENHRRE